MILSLGMSMPALAQWQWLDANGRRVYSDQPPPAGTPESKIVKRPGASLSPGPASPASVEPVAATKPPSSDLDRKAREVKEHEERAARLEQEKGRQVINENCQQARKSLSTLSAGTRISIVNDKGEQDYMSDEQRAADMQRLQGYISANCQ